MSELINNYYCECCKESFHTLKDSSCPYCGKYCWILRFSISDGLEKVYDVEGNCMYMTKEQAQEYRAQMLALLKAFTPVSNGKSLGIPIVWGTAGEIDKTGYAEFFKELFYTPPEWHCKPVKNRWAEGSIEPYFNKFKTPENMNKEKKNWFGEQLNLWDSDEDGIFPANMGLWIKRQEERHMRSFKNFTEDYKLSILNQVSEYLMHKHPGSKVEFMKALPESGESGFHITSDTQAISIAVAADLQEILVPELGVNHTFIHRKKEREVEDEQQD